MIGIFYLFDFDTVYVPIFNDNCNLYIQCIWNHFKSSITGITILKTECIYHYRDHSGGNQEMKRQYPNIRIYGGIHDNVNNVTE